MIALILLSQAAQVFSQVTLETSCFSNENCGQFETCRNSKCQCSPNYHIVDGYCKLNVLIGAVCSEESTCSGGAICVDNVCSCVDGHIEKNGICTPQNALNKIISPSVIKTMEQTPLKKPDRPSIGLAGKPCGLGDVCRPMSMCREGICQCRNGYIASFGECIRNPSVRRIYVKPLPVNGG